MCVLQPCANPTGVGIWWRDDTKWCLYGKSHDSLIREGVSKGLGSIDLGTITSVVHPKGARYTADLKKMEQVAVASGQRRPIKMIDGPVILAALHLSRPPQQSLEGGPSGGNASARVHYRDPTGQLIEYDQEICNALLQALVGGHQRSLVLEHKQSRRLLYFDLDRMEQRFVEGFSNSDEAVFSDELPRKVVIEVPWNPAAMMKLVIKADGTMRTKILVMTVERYRSEEHLDAMLPAFAKPRTIVSKEADLQSVPGHRSFEGFVDALEASLSSCPKIIESFIKLRMPREDEISSRVQLAFKPLDRKENQTTTKAFWRSMAAPIVHAVVYGTAIINVMVYLVILPEALGETERRCREEAEVIIDRPDHCLSLAQVSVC